jgi:hypothetical protein
MYFVEMTELKLVNNDYQSIITIRSNVSKNGENNVKEYVLKIIGGEPSLGELK